MKNVATKFVLIVCLVIALASCDDDASHKQKRVSKIVYSFKPLFEWKKEYSVAYAFRYNEDKLLEVEAHESGYNPTTYAFMYDDKNRLSSVDRKPYNSPFCL